MTDPAPAAAADAARPPGTGVASAEELRELALTYHEQIVSLRREVADSHHLMEALRALLDEGDDTEPFTNVFAMIAPLFKYQQALVLVENDEAAPTVHCLVASDPALAGMSWPRTTMVDRSLAGRVIATVARAEDPLPEQAIGAGLQPHQPALYMPLRFRDQRGLMMLRRAADAVGFDRRDVAVARKLSLLASQALATRQANRAERERRELKELTDELRAAQNTLTYLANHDELTGLVSRRYFEEQAAAAIAAAGPEERIGIAFIDLDGFKQVNDYYGHEIGDDLLKAVADRLNTYTFDDTDMLARISGDEFMILINPVRGVDYVVELVRAGLNDMRRPFLLGERQLMVSASVGLAFYPDHGGTFEEVRRNADMAMYRAKHTMPGSVMLYQPHMAVDVVNRLDQEQALRRAVAEKRFRAVFQPKVRLGDMTVAGFEILARQVDGSGRIGSSAAFIGLAGQMGLLDEISQIVLDDALTSLTDLRGAFGEGISFSINIATHQATDPRKLREAIEQIRAVDQAGAFVIEVTEDALLELETFRRDIAPLLDAANMRVSIDDFGTGFASLSRLLVINADEIKIDRSFIHAVDERPRGQVFLEAMSTIGGELGATVVAEGVETVAELAYLMGGTAVDEVQGYLIGWPELASAWMGRRDSMPAHLARLQQQITTHLATRTDPPR